MAKVHCVCGGCARRKIGDFVTTHVNTTAIEGRTTCDADRSKRWCQTGRHFIIRTAIWIGGWCYNHIGALSHRGFSGGNRIMYRVFARVANIGHGQRTIGVQSRITTQNIFGAIGYIAQYSIGCVQLATIDGICAGRRNRT